MLKQNRAGKLLSAAPLVAAYLLVGAAAAQGLPPTYEQLAKDGLVLAERLCSSCHVVDGKQQGAATAGIPTFRGIANRKDQTAAHIRHILINPHPPMPDVRLSNPEIDRLITFLDSLRAEASGPPLVPRGSAGRKPVYPDPT